MPRTDFELNIDFIRYALIFRRVPGYLSDLNLFMLTLVYVERTLDLIFEDYKNFDENLYLIFKEDKEEIVFGDGNNFRLLKRRINSIMYTLDYIPEFAEYHDIKKRCEVIKCKYNIIKRYWLNIRFERYNSIKIMFPIILVLLAIVLISLRTYGYVYYDE